MPAGQKPKTIGELRRSGYRTLSVREELRKNLIARIESGEAIFPGIIGFEDTVIPQLENAILAGQDIIILGERGQAKSRIIRQLVTLLDDEVPYISDCEINDSPDRPACRRCKNKVAREGDEVEISWLPRAERYAEKLATPDVSVADLIGEIDPIKVAEGRYLSDELTIHYGLIPRTNRGVFCINELPDLPERIQVSLFNLMEERDVQIKGYRIMLPLDVYVVASANPEDYTNRGRIITPLKDRYGAQVRTHYPETSEHEMAIVEQEYRRFPDVSEQVTVPQYMKEIVGEITRLARRSAEINQRSGVSLRVSITNYETLLGIAFKRSLRLREPTSPRLSDLPGMLASTVGKIELESVEEGREAKVVDDLIKKAVLEVFNSSFSIGDFGDLVAWFEEGLTVEVGNDIPSSEYVEQLSDLDGLPQLIKRIESSDEPAAVASAMELLLEGLHLNRKINRDPVAGKYVYRHRPPRESRRGGSRTQPARDA